MNAKVGELCTDEAFLKELGKTANAEEAVKLFEAHGGEITLDELNALKAKANDLSEDDLAGVAGGVDLGMVGDFKVKTVVKTIVTVTKWFA